MHATRNAAVVAVALASTLCLGCPAAQKRQTQLRQARRLTPTVLRPTRTGDHKVLTARVRVYADGPYRSQNTKWQLDMSRVFNRANAVLTPGIGLRLELERSLAWERTTTTGGPETMLVELERLDPGQDVDFVIGLVDALPEVSTSMKQLGHATLLGRHIVLRGMNDLKEYELFEQAFDWLSESERRSLYRKRRVHKQTAILLHEIAHSLGGLHVTEKTRLLYPVYSHEMVSFSPYTARLMRVALQARFATDDHHPRSAMGPVADYLHDNEWSGWDPDERKRLIVFLRDGARPDPSAGPELSSAVRPADRTVYTSAKELTAKGRHDDAWEAAEALFSYYPDEPGIQLLRCRLAMKRAPGTHDAVKHCRHAGKLLPDNPTAELLIAQAAVNGSDPRAALASLLRAEARLEGSPGNHASSWKLLATSYRQLGAVSYAERAALAAGDLDDILRWAASVRAQFALPPNAASVGIPPDREAEYVAAMRAMLKLVYARKFDEAASAVSKARRKFRRAPGVDVVACDLAIRKRDFARARRHCRAAVKAFDGTAWGHYLLGLLDKRDKKPKPAVEHLERAIQLDTTLRHAYEVLAKLYREAGKDAELAALDKRYREAFRRPLP